MDVAHTESPMSSKSPTLRDLAAATGVHLSTVSRVMNPHTRQTVSTDVAKRILAEEKRAGYRSNRSKSALSLAIPASSAWSCPTLPTCGKASMLALMRQWPRATAVSP